MAEPSRLVLTAIKGQAATGTFDLFAVGGPVRWVIHVPATATVTITVRPLSGYLPTGGSWVVVHVTVKSLISLNTRLVADPGNVIITIVLSIKL